MVVVDANVLVYAVDTSSSHHERSFEWLERSLSGTEAVGFAWVALLAFVRLTTNRSIMPEPLTPAEALDQAEAWTGAPAGVVTQPTPRHAAVLRGLLDQAGSAGNLTNDAHLAALAIEHGAEVVSFDRDFARFLGVTHRLPA